MSKRKFGNVKGCESTTDFNGQKNTSLSLINISFASGLYLYAFLVNYLVVAYIKFLNITSLTLNLLLLALEERNDNFLLFILYSL